MPSNPDPSTSKYNQRGDVWQHSYAYHYSVLRTAERSEEYHDICDRLYFRAQVTEAGDRVTAQLMRDAIAHIQALELRIDTMKRPPEGGA